MRICRYEYRNRIALGFYHDDTVVPLTAAATYYCKSVKGVEALMDSTSILDFLPHGLHADTAVAVNEWMLKNPQECSSITLPITDVRLLRPIETPAKILLLAGNYAAHIREGGEAAVERAETFPYVFMKPSTTYNDPDAPIPVPRVSPDHVDYECELGVVMGCRCKHVSEEDALNYVAGYTVVNDISDRKYKPFPNRKERPKDGFFDWLHGKWHDGFCPMGPCVVSSKTVANPQTLALTQHINGELRQNASTAQMIFPVAAVIAFISQSVTLTPGDIISTGTSAGIGMPLGKYLHAGDKLEAAIEGIGILRNTMTNEE